MFDLRAIRDDPASFDRGWARRGLEPKSAVILALDAERRQVQTRLQVALARRNEASKEVGDAKRNKDEARAAALMSEVAQIKADLPSLEETEKALGEQLDGLLAGLPNLPAADVPDGRDETGNVEIRRFGTPPDIAEPRITWRWARVWA